MTPYPARTFDRVIGVDVSPGNPATAERHLSQQAIRNVDLVQLTSIMDLDRLAGFGFLFLSLSCSIIPACSEGDTRQSVSKMNPGEGCRFKIPTELPD